MFPAPRARHEYLVKHISPIRRRFGARLWHFTPRTAGNGGNATRRGFFIDADGPRIEKLEVQPRSLQQQGQSIGGRQAGRSLMGLALRREL